MRLLIVLILTLGLSLSANANVTPEQPQEPAWPETPDPLPGSCEIEGYPLCLEEPVTPSPPEDGEESEDQGEPPKL